MARWKKHLRKELGYQREFTGLDVSAWRALLRKSHITSQNHDTFIAIDWPHYCSHASVNCGGAKGWCYTFQGFQASNSHARKVAMNDVLAREQPELFAEVVSEEVFAATADKNLAYPNIRFSGSGETTFRHLKALERLLNKGIVVWGFTRNLKLAVESKRRGISAILSIDASTASSKVLEAQSYRLPLAFTSSSVEERPPDGTVVTFPLHRSGRVSEVVDADSLCPKVVEEFFNGKRQSNYCQQRCHRCHGFGEEQVVYIR